MTHLTVGANEVVLSGDMGPFAPRLTARSESPDVELVTLEIIAPTPAAPPRLSMLFKAACVDIQSVWTPTSSRNKGLSPNWSSGQGSRATWGAPVIALVSGDGRNRLTLAVSDALNPIQLRANIVEESASFECGAVFFEQPAAPITRYEATIRIDRRPVPYYKALDDVRAWWEQFPEYSPAPAPEAARRPMYSTWYSLHQHLSPDVIEAQCRMAKKLGCEAVIVDDGWQTANNERGYAYCGDWEVFDGKIPDMAAHVARVHDIGLKYILWYSVPFIGVHSRAWTTFQDKLLRPLNRPGEVGVIDPRYPDAREYLIRIYEKAVQEWDLDGFKLDFVDSFVSNPDAPIHPDQVDTQSVPEAVDRLLSEVISRLRKLKPEICVEFRQCYIGPLMRKYGNMFRSADCPDDSVQNRVNTVDLRLLSGSTATHADMLMWHLDEPAESAALQFLNILFSVPQISVMLDRIPGDHLRMLRFWMGFWNRFRHVLLDAPIEPVSPELLYPAVSATRKGVQILVDYGSGLVECRQDVERLIVINAKREPGTVVKMLPWPQSWVRVYDCFGAPVENRISGEALDGRLADLTIPPAGHAIVVKSRADLGFSVASNVR